MLLNSIRTATFSAMLILACGICTTALGQVDTGGIDTGGIDPGQPTDTTADTGGGSTNVGQGVGVGDLDNAVLIESSDDVRNQGFVGATAPGIQELGYIGAVSENSGPPLASGATFGGGVNGSVSSSFSVGGTNAGRGGAGGFATAGNGVSVTRRSLRAKLRPSFTSPRPSSEQVSSRFDERFFRQPGSESLLGQYSIRIDNRTAYINGSVNSKADSDRLVRQLRLEPGVYKIVNQLQVPN